MEKALEGSSKAFSHFLIFYLHTITLENVSDTELCLPYINQAGTPAVSVILQLGIVDRVHPEYGNPGCGINTTRLERGGVVNYITNTPC